VADDEPNRSPIALALSRDGSRLLTANQTSGSVSLVDTHGRKLLHEVPTGEKPAGVALSADGRIGVVTHWYGYDVAILSVGPERLEVIGRVEVGPEPRGVAIGPDGKTAYVAVGIADQVVRIDLDQKAVTGKVAVGREPRSIALTPDGRRLLVANARSQSMSLIDLASWTVEKTLPVGNDNLRQVSISPDGKYGHVATMKNRGFATTKGNIDIGWVLGQRLTRVALDGSEDDFETLTLDPRGQAVGDAHGTAVSPDGKYLAVSCGGTHEVVIFRTDSTPLPWRLGGSRDLIPGELLTGDGRFRRVPVGGRPTELAFDPDGRTLYVANYLADAIQVVDAESAKLVATVPLGGPTEPSLARQGEAIFHDAQRSFNQWYSCNTCHSDGHTNGLDYDTMNDGWQDLSTAHLRSRKKAPTLRGVTHTGPWTWHGWQTSLEDAMVESFTKSMQGPKPSPDDVRAITAYLDTLEYPRNPYRNADGSLSEAAERGREVYRSPRARCQACHGGPELTDGKIHDVGLNERGDVYRGHNPPSLRGTYDKAPYLHDGRAKTLRDVLTKDHDPDQLNAAGELTEQELDDLIAYLMTL
jgi:YVTN family beta-propeller protein